MSDEALDDLHRRLEHPEWPDEIAGSDSDHGINLDVLKDFATYWRDSFDWRAQEQRLNVYAHFRAEVEGFQLHFLHEPANQPGAVPLLLLHGWPSSFVKMLPILPLLTEQAGRKNGNDVVFDVVAVSLPGYGFSARPTSRGMSVARIARLMHGLMTDVLGYGLYGIRGSDLGAGVMSPMALDHSESVIGIHGGGTNPWVIQVPDDLTPAEQCFIAQAQEWTAAEMAYAMEHATKPQTIAAALNDSPVGLAAWILEKFRRWSDCAGDLETRFTKDELLTNLTIYWATETIGSSMRLYYETMRDPGGWRGPDVPTAMLMSTKDLFATPRSWVERHGRVDRWTEISEGGHFLEWEAPNIVADDLRAFFKSTS